MCLFLKIPFFVVITKIDLAPQNKLDETFEELKKILKSKILNKIPIPVKEGTSKNELAKLAEMLGQNTICPIFTVSSVKVLGFDKLVDFISLLQLPQIS